MKLRILNPEKLVTEAEVVSVTLPGSAGQLTPLAHHDRLLTPLTPGRVYFTKTDQGGREDYNIDQGFAEILPTQITLYVDRAQKVSS